MDRFLQAYLRVLVDAIGSDFTNNYDSDRFGSEEPPSKNLKTILSAVLGSVGLATTRARAMAVSQARDTIATGLSFVESHLPDLTTRCPMENHGSG